MIKSRLSLKTVFHCYIFSYLYKDKKMWLILTVSSMWILVFIRNSPAAFQDLPHSTQTECVFRMDCTISVLSYIFQLCSPTVATVTGWGRGRNDGEAWGGFTGGFPSHLNLLPVSPASADVKGKKKKKDGIRAKVRTSAIFC